MAEDTITPGEPSHVGTFTIKIPNFDQQVVQSTLKLQPGTLFTRDALGDDITRIRQALIAQGYLAPTLKDPRVEFDKDTNKINITVEGEVGPKVTVTFRNYTLSEKQKQQLQSLNNRVDAVEDTTRKLVETSGATRDQPNAHGQGGPAIPVDSAAALAALVAKTAKLLHAR